MCFTLKWFIKGVAQNGDVSIITHFCRKDKMAHIVTFLKIFSNFNIIVPKSFNLATLSFAKQRFRALLGFDLLN